MRMSIKTKTFMFYIIISVAVFLSFNVIVTSKLKSNNKKIVINDMKELKERTLNYINETRVFLNKNVDFKNKDAVKELRFDLSESFNEQLIIYINGETISEFAPLYLNYDFKETSFLNKDENIVAFDINYFKDKAVVDFPIKLNKNNTDVVIRYFVDYTDMLITERKIQTVIFVLSFVFSLLIIILSMVNSNNLLKKVFKIKDFTKNIIDNDFSSELCISSKDEMGELSDDLNEMKKRISEQIETIKKDRDEIKKISSYKKTFYDSVTHELKTPITNIMGYSELLLEELDDDFHDIEAIKIINQESYRLLKLVKSILDMSFYNEVNLYKNKELFDLNQLVNSITSKMKFKANKFSVSIINNIHEKLIINENKDAIKAILINLIDNSIKYNKMNGSITISATKIDNSIELSIEDTGLGISKEDLNKIFKPFYKVKEVDNYFQSSGLGLAIVDSIAKLIGAKIIVTSDIGIGTIIIIKIPFDKTLQ
ncbi:HAMP domain-containing sensor histidine kinase [Clostridiaceae bacterium M8S5]|nr:HAMP domain-containing sensor histidine kinase [Clostridiaceae bacterium M8S5]